MSTALPESPVGRQLEWVFGLLEGGGEPELDEIRERLAASFLAAVPAEQFVVVTEQAAGALKEFTFDRFEQEPTPTQAVAVLTLPSGDAFRVRIAVEERKPHRITGLLLQPAPDLRAEPAATSWEELEDKLRPLASRVSFLAAELNGRDLAPVFEIEPDLHLGIGSAFKLYVLGELARQVSSGSIAWDDELEISDRHRSIPSGVMQDAEAGTRYPVREFAEKMISISDNTATDHLLDRLGRKEVEAVQKAMGHSDPARNVPFLSTREMTIIKAGLSAKQQKAYVDANATTRRAILDTKLAERPVPDIGPTGWPEPRLVDSVEWFASAGDMCRAMAWLTAVMARPYGEPVKSILSVNPGLPLDRYAWEYIGYKGGGEPGVLNMTWLLRRIDGQWFTLSASLNDDSSSSNTMEVAGLMLSAGALLAMHRGKRKRKR